jgi:universal stress protein A
MSTDPYRHLLVAVDFAPESEPVIARAVEMRDRLGARLTLLNVVDYVASGAEYTGGAFIADPVLPEDTPIERELLATAAQQMDLLGDRLGVPPQDRIVEAGPTGRSILHVAEDLNVDLIVVGAHDRNWLSRLFGSTSRALLAREPCDLLAVRIPKADDPSGS